MRRYPRAFWRSSHRDWYWGNLTPVTTCMGGLLLCRSVCAERGFQRRRRVAGGWNLFCRAACVPARRYSCLFSFRLDELLHALSANADDARCFRGTRCRTQDVTPVGHRATGSSITPPTCSPSGSGTVRGTPRAGDDARRSRTRAGDAKVTHTPADAPAAGRRPPG